MDHELTSELLARLERLEDANRQLSAQVEQLTVRADDEPDDHIAAAGSSPVGRRGLLKRVGALAVGATALTAAGQVISAPSAAAADGQPLIMGARTNESTSPTQYGLDARGTDQTALIVFNTATAGGNRLTRAVYGGATDVGVQGVGNKRAGVVGLFGPLADGFQVDRAGVGGVGAQGAVGVLGISDSADGVLGRSNGTAGVHGTCANNGGYGVLGDGDGVAGVGGFSSYNVGVKGFTDEGRGVLGFAPQAMADTSAGVHGVLVAETGPYPGANLGFAGVVGESRDYGGVKGASGGYIGVEGTSTNGDGVVGHSTNYRGGVFTGGSAAVKLVPGTRATPPTAGETGDLYVDSTGRLWYCRQSGNNWVNLA